MRKYRSSLRHRPYITFKFKVSEIFKKIIAKDPLTPQEFDIFIGKFQILQICHKLFHTGHYGIASSVRNASEEHVEIGDVICHACLKIAVGHGELVKVCQHGQIHFVFHWDLLRCFI